MQLQYESFSIVEGQTSEARDGDKSAIPFEASNLLERTRAIDLSIEIVALAHSDADVEHLQKFGANRIVLGELEIAREMAGFLFPEEGTFVALDSALLTPNGDAFERAQIGLGSRAREDGEGAEESARISSSAASDASR